MIGRVTEALLPLIGRLIGRLSLQGRPAALLTGEKVPPFLSLYHRDRDVAVYRVAFPAWTGGGSAGGPAPPAGE